MQALNTSASRSRAPIELAFPLIGLPLALISPAFPLVSRGLPLTGDALTLISLALALIEHMRARS